MGYRLEMPKRSTSWTRVAIFTSLYVLLLESIIEWSLVLCLYGNQQVDTKMAPSLILVFIASSFTVPLVALHSLLAWQYNQVSGFDTQKTILRVVSTYLLRLTIIVWLAASVAGLILVAQHISCLPDTATGGFWNVGVSCALHRATVIVAIISFITVCLYFCSRELCDSPYDISLLGVYKDKSCFCDDSIFTQGSLETDNTLKNDAAYHCRTPEATYRASGLCLSSSDTSFEKHHGLNLQHPAPIRPAAQLNIGGDYRSERAEILSGTSPSPIGTLRSTSDGVSRTPTTGTSRTGVEPSEQPPVPELPGGLVLPGAGHMRQKSSLSVRSLRKYLPKLFQISLPLSLDPQIRALSDPSEPCDRDIEKQSDEAENNGPESQIPAVSDEKQLAPPPINGPDHAPVLVNRSSETRPQKPRTMTMNSADAPEVVVPQSTVRRTNTSYTAPILRSPPPHTQPAYRPVPPNPLAWHPVNPAAPLRRASAIEPDQIHRQASSPALRRHTQAYQFEQSQIPRYTRSQYHPPTRYGSYGRAPRRMSSWSARNDIRILYPSTRRPRSTTCGGIAAGGSLDAIRETGASVDESPSSDISDENTYRGTTRTSVHGC